MAYKWSARDNTLLDDHLKYHGEMCAYLQQLQSEGPELCEEMPKKPRGNLSSLLNLQKTKSTKLSGKELHEYLMANISTEVSPQWEWDPNNFTRIKETLVRGYHCLKQAHSNTFATSIDYGYYLNKGFDVFTHLRNTGKMEPADMTFQHFLEDNVGISDSYVGISRKLRSISKNFHQYKKFRKLGISFDEFYSRREEIRIMLSLDKDIDRFWSQE